MRTKRALSLLLLCVTSCVSKQCSEDRGPRIIIGTEEKILSPFPADRLTLPDPKTPTGLRVDLPVKDESTALERTLTDHANQLDGFGLFSPLCVRFDRPLDIASITPDSCYLVNVDDGSFVPLDFGSGCYPVDLARPVSFFPNDPQHPSLILPPGNRVPYYEDSTNALILRPKVPLKPASKYVVLLTRRLRGENGEPIEAPPDEPPTPQEFEDYTKAMSLLGAPPIEVAFYWTFTTHSLSRELEAIRAGMDGQGSLSWLASQVPAKFASLHDLKYGLTDLNPYTLEAPVASALYELLHQLATILEPVYPDLVQLTRTFRPFIADLGNVDYFVFGTIESPNFIEFPDGLFQVDPKAGTARVKASKVPFMLSVPKPTEENNFAQAPYPVVVQGHGLTVSRLQIWPLANRLAAQGLATICVDLVGHGPMEQFYMFPKILKNLQPPLSELAKPVVISLGVLLGIPVNPFSSLSEMVDQVFSQGILAPITGEGRAIDVDGDGNLDPAMGFFSSDFFRMRDNIRQCVVDLMQCVRAVRGLQGRSRVDGDVNGDGVLDLGGPNRALSYAGISLGSIIGGIVMALDPLLPDATLNVAGGGLGDIMFRTTVLNETFVRYVIRDVFGLAIVGRLQGDEVRITWNKDPIESAFWSVPVEYVSKIEVKNATKGTVETTTAGSGGAFSVVLAADVGDVLELTITSAWGEQLKHARVAPVAGLGVARSTTRSREFQMLLSWFMEPADPICYAPSWWQKPLAGVPPKNVLVQLSCADPVVPVASGVSLARAAGLVSPERMAKLAELGIPLGANTAVDVKLPVESDKFRALRFHASGKHAYIIGGNQKNIALSVRIGMAAQRQLASFLVNKGGSILKDEAFEDVLPDDNGELLFKIPLPPGVSLP